MSKDRFKHIPGSDSGKADYRRKFNADSERRYRENPCWDKFKLEKKEKESL